MIILKPFDKLDSVMSLIVLIVTVCFSFGTAQAQYGGYQQPIGATISDVTSSNNNVYVVWYNYDMSTKSYDILLKASNDGGHSFGNMINLTEQFGVHPYSLPISVTKLSSSGSSVYLAWTQYNAQNQTTTAFITKSTNNGTTFGKKTVVDTIKGRGIIDSIFSDENKILVIFGNSVLESIDGGYTFRTDLGFPSLPNQTEDVQQASEYGSTIYMLDRVSYWGSEANVLLLRVTGDNVDKEIPLDFIGKQDNLQGKMALSGSSIYLVYTQQDGSSYDIYFAKSVDGGTTFVDRTLINDNGSDSRWPHIVADGKNICISWVQNNPSGGVRFLFKKSTDGGDTFGSEINLGGYTAGNYDYTQLGLLGNSTIYAVWTGEYNSSYSKSGIFLRESKDDGNTFGDTFDINGWVGHATIANPSISSVESHIYLAGDSGSPGVHAIIFRASYDGGVSFTGPIDLNTDHAVRAGNEERLEPIPQFTPQLPSSSTTNSGFSSDQTASFVLGQPDFVSTQPAPAAGSFSGPSFIMFDSTGNLWVSDGGNDRVLEFRPPFSMGEYASVVLGQKDFVSWQRNSVPDAATLGHPQGLAFDRLGNLWVADTADNRILEFQYPFTTGENASLVIGQHDFVSAGSSNPPTNSSLYSPQGVTFDPAGNLWVADSSSRILEFKTPITNGETASLILGRGGSSCWPCARSLNGPTELMFDSEGNLWVADSFDYRILEFKPPFADFQNASLDLGQPSFTSPAEGVGSTSSSLRFPTGISFDKSADLWVADGGNNRVLEFEPPFSSEEAASLILGPTNYDAGAVNSAGHTNSTFDSPGSLAFDSNGNLWVADTGNNRVLSFLSKYADQAKVAAEMALPNPSEIARLSVPNLAKTSQETEYQKKADELTECARRNVVRNDNSTAIGLAENSPKLKSRAQGYSYKFDSIFNILNGCKLQTVNVVFTLTDSEGKFVKNVVVTEDPSLTKILNVTEQQGGQYGASGGGSTASSANRSTQSEFVPLQLGPAASDKTSQTLFEVLAAVIACAAGGISIFVIRKK